MRRRYHIGHLVAAAALTGLAVMGARSAVERSHATTSSCHVLGHTPATYRPDPTCTPGVTNPSVTQANIGSTICVRGWTATIRPPVSYTQPLKQKIADRYGIPPNGELDHLISLELGGSPRDPRNLWVEPGPIPNPKDSVENRLRQDVCAGSLTLRQAQLKISTDWTSA